MPVSQPQGDTHMISGKERLLVCVGSAPTSERVIMTGASMAKALSADWVALHVEQTGNPQTTMMEDGRLRQHLLLAEDLGADVEVVKGKTIAEEIIRYAQEKNINRIVIGRRQYGRESFLRVSPEDTVDRLLACTLFLDIYVVPDDRENFENIEQRVTKPISQLRPATIRSSLLGLLIMAAVNILGLVFYATGFSEANIIMIFILGVLLISVIGGRWLGLAASAISVLAFNFLFTDPRFTLDVNDRQYLITFPVMLVVALLSSELTARVKHEASQSAIREQRTAILYQASQRLLRATGQSSVVTTALEHLRGLVHRSAVCYLPAVHSDKDLHRIGFGGDEAELLIDPSEVDTAHWVFKNLQPAGRGTNNSTHVAGYYIPLISQEKVLGVLGVNCESEPLDREQRSLVESVAAQLALALDRERLTREQETMRVEMEREKLQSNLLRSMSHDLRTPLTAISGAGSTLLESETKIGSKTRKELLKGILNETDWLTRLVENLLSLTRVEGGSLSVQREWEVVEEVIASVVGRLRNRSSEHKIRIDLPQEPLLAFMDASLIQQVLTNIIDNAVTYTVKGSQIVVRASNDDKAVFIEVEDNGPGIPKEAKNRVFERFFTVGAHREVDRRGMGLGLAICKSIVEAHNGKISVRDAPGGGSIFRILLPSPETQLRNSVALAVE